MITSVSRQPSVGIRGVIAACMTALLATACTNAGDVDHQPPTRRSTTAPALPSPTVQTFHWSRYPTCQEFAGSFADQTYRSWSLEPASGPTPSPGPEAASAGRWLCALRGSSKDGRASGLTYVWLSRPSSINSADGSLETVLRSEADSIMRLPCEGAEIRSLPGDYLHSQECISTSATPTVHVAVVFVGRRGVASAGMEVQNQEMSADEARGYAETTAIGVAKLAFSRL